MLTKCLAQNLAPHGILVDAIGPGFIETPMTASLRADEKRSRWAMAMTPMGRYRTPEEIAGTALFLASDDASFFTGELCTRREVCSSAERQPRMICSGS